MTITRVLDQIGHRRIVLRVEDLVAAGGRPVERLLHRHRRIDHLEGQLGRLVEHVLQPLRILRPGT